MEYKHSSKGYWDPSHGITVERTDYKSPFEIVAPQAVIIGMGYHI